MAGLRQSVRELRGVGPSTATKLARIGISTVLDLLSYFPIRHEDLRRSTPIDHLRADVTAVVRGRLQLISRRRGFRRRRMSITEGLLTDRTGTIKIVWFNQPYLTDQFAPGDDVYVIGKLMPSAYGMQMQSPLIEHADRPSIHVGRIVPLYRLTAGLSQRQLRTIIHAALPNAASLPEWLPATIVRSEGLLPLRDALREIHAPTSLPRLTRARERLTFGEILPYIIATMRTDHERHARTAPRIPLDRESVSAFVSTLPFRLTLDQRVAAWEIIKDLDRPRAMHRLLEGDVGSGKTAVAAIAAFAVARAGRQVALLAPTDILARQHYQTFSRFLPQEVPIGLLTRTQRTWTLREAPSKRSILGAVRDGTVKVIIGTHAILGNTVEIPSISLVIVDEQHRFGVEQRHAMQEKGAEATLPHLLSMSATPIPRTLALTLFGDLSISLLRTMPTGRMPITTELLTTSEEMTAFDAIRSCVTRGEQAYVVCPLIEESDEGGITAATSEFERLANGPLRGLRLGLLHGALPVKEKNRVLDAFASRAIDVIVTTPVIEVGVDIPNATIIVIEGAERFGLAQLHQMRGRVGRSAASSSCFLISDSTSETALRRLRTVKSVHDGFALAEEDLRQRGPGDLYGIRQTGLPLFSMASVTDLQLMKRIRTVAEQILADDPTLTRSPAILKKVEAFSRSIHKE